MLVRFFAFIRALIYGPETGMPKLDAEEALKRLGFATTSMADFVQSFLRVYLEKVEPETTQLVEQWLPALLQPAWEGEWATPDVLDLCLRAVLEMRELDHTSVAETGQGYLAVVPVGAQLNDWLCLLHRSDSASVMRKAGAAWLHVGHGYGFGLSDHRAVDFEAGLGEYSVLEVQ